MQGDQGYGDFTQASLSNFPSSLEDVKLPLSPYRHSVQIQVVEVDKHTACTSEPESRASSPIREQVPVGQRGRRPRFGLPGVQLPLKKKNPGRNPGAKQNGSVLIPRLMTWRGQQSYCANNLATLSATTSNRVFVACVP